MHTWIHVNLLQNYSFSQLFFFFKKQGLAASGLPLVCRGAASTHLTFFKPISRGVAWYRSLSLLLRRVLEYSKKHILKKNTQ